MNAPEIIRRGKDNGEGMVVRYQTARGTAVFGLAVPNLWGGEGWDLGPTWCYLILGQKTILIDTGRFGNFETLENLLHAAGKKLSEIDAIIITHCHEDHDGNLAEVISGSDSQLWAHNIYPSMISYFPDIEDGANHPELPGSCRFCVMPEEFHSTCIPYHQKRYRLKVDLAINDTTKLPVEGFRVIHTPGHSPDSICITLDDEAVFTGDTVLPGITPHPSTEAAYQTNRMILPEEYQHQNTVYGLAAYISSLSKLASIDAGKFSAAFPAHRLFYYGEFNLIQSTRERAREIIQFHIDRCNDILRILSSKPLGLDNIAEKHFLPSQLEGSGIFLARSELTAHIEVMENCGDIRWIDDNREAAEHTGSHNFRNTLGTYLS